MYEIGRKVLCVNPKDPCYRMLGTVIAKDPQIHFPTLMVMYRAKTTGLHEGQAWDLAAPRNSCWAQTPSDLIKLT